MKLKFLADVNIEKPVVDYLRDSRLDIKWVSDFNRQMDDEDLMMLAKTERRILLTNDKDFGELIFLQKKLSHGIILLRVKGQATGLKVMLVKKLMEKYRDKLAGYFVIVTKDKFRFIPLEDNK